MQIQIQTLSNILGYHEIPHIFEILAIKSSRAFLNIVSIQSVMIQYKEEGDLQRMEFTST